MEVLNGIRSIYRRKKIKSTSFCYRIRMESIRTHPLPLGPIIAWNLPLLAAPATLDNICLPRDGVDAVTFQTIVTSSGDLKKLYELNRLLDEPNTSPV